MPHKAQLLVCHQQIAAGHQGPLDSPQDWERARKRFCDLHAYAWCWDCDYFVCDLHLNTRHFNHHTDIEFPKEKTWSGLKPPS